MSMMQYEYMLTALADTKVDLGLDQNWMSKQEQKIDNVKCLKCKPKSEVSRLIEGDVGKRELFAVSLMGSCKGMQTNTNYLQLD